MSPTGLPVTGHGPPVSASPPLPPGILMLQQRGTQGMPLHLLALPQQCLLAWSHQNLGQNLSYGGRRRQPTDFNFHPGWVLGSLGSAAAGHELLCTVQLSLLPCGAAKAAAPRCRGCASHAGNSRLFNLLNYWQIPAANNPWLANDLQTACGRRFALGGWFCVGCVRRAAEPARGLGIAFADSTLLLDKFSEICEI